MDKKTIIAFILIGAVIVLWGPYQRWISPPQRRQTPQDTYPKMQQEQDLEVEVVPQPVQSPETQSSGRTALASVDTAGVSRDIVVDTDIYRAILTTAGATLRSWRLKAFEGVGTPWVELMPPDPLGALSLSVNSQDGRIEMYRYNFTCEVDSIILDETNTTASVEMELNLQDGISIQKVFRFQRGSYSFDMDVIIDGMGGLVPTREYELVWDPGLASTELNIKEDMAKMAACARLGDDVAIFNIGRKDRTLDRREDGTTGWVGIRNKYFLMAMIPREDASRGIQVKGQKSSIAVGKNTLDLKIYSVALRMSLNPTGPTRHHYEVYIGPQNYSVLRNYGFGLEKCMDMGWAVIQPISRIILAFFVFVHKFIPNYGIVIIIFSILLKVLFYPLTHKQLESTRKMQELQPQLAALKEKYKNDPQRLNKETMTLYKQAGANPLGGCLPLLLQMPVFFALFSVFRSTIELRRADFVFWIKDLSLKDPYFILPIIMAVTMFVQQKMTMKDPKQATMVYMMPAIMFFFFMNFASGLVLYWTVFNILSILQQVFVEKRGKLPVKQ